MKDNETKTTYQKDESKKQKPVNPFGGNNKKPKPGGQPKFNPYWIYGGVLILFLLFQFLPSSKAKTTQIRVEVGLPASINRAIGCASNINTTDVTPANTE